LLRQPVRAAPAYSKGKDMALTVHHDTEHDCLTMTLGERFDTHR
jgi:hypothetical protein